MTSHNTLKICHKTSSQTGTLIGDSVLITKSHLFNPSVESIEIPLIIPSSKTCKTSITTFLPLAFFGTTFNAS
jgi:hypothetical protein